MTAAIVTFSLYLAAGIFLTWWGTRAEGGARKVYLAVEGALCAIGAALSAISYFAFGRLPWEKIPDDGFLEWAREAFSVYAKIAFAAFIAVFLLSALLVLVRSAQKYANGSRYGGALIFVAPFSGAFAIFVAASLASVLSADFEKPVVFEIVSFALGLSLSLRGVFLLNGAIGMRKERTK